MRRLVISGLAFCLALTGSAWAQDGIGKTARVLFQPIPDSAPAMENNPASPARLELGKMLFFEPRLSSSHLISCNTCHNVGLGGVDLQETSVGHGWQKGPRNAPTVLNSVFNIAQFWDGRARDLAEQAKGPVQASVEMNNTPAQVITTLKSMPEYVALFAQAFPGEKEPLTFDNMAKAIEVFEATLITPNAPFDRFLQGEEQALTATEKEGLQLFVNKGCAGCHSGKNIGGTSYFPFGVREAPASEVRPPGDVGRFQVTNTAADRYVFKSPSLRNIALTPPYFHSGKVWRLADAVRVMGTAQLGMDLSPAETEKITLFLRTLTGERPQLLHPVLPPNSNTTPRPVLASGPAK
jgi:cytochrome c peroxidase